MEHLCISHGISNFPRQYHCISLYQHTVLSSVKLSCVCVMVTYTVCAVLFVEGFVWSDLVLFCLISLIPRHMCLVLSCLYVVLLVYYIYYMFFLKKNYPCAAVADCTAWETSKGLQDQRPCSQWMNILNREADTHTWGGGHTLYLCNVFFLSPRQFISALKNQTHKKWGLGPTTA